MLSAAPSGRECLFTNGPQGWREARLPLPTFFRAFSAKTIKPLWNNLLPGGVAPELVDDRTNGGSEAAVRR